MESRRRCNAEDSDPRAAPFHAWAIGSSIESRSTSPKASTSTSLRSSAVSAVSRKNERGSHLDAGACAQGFKIYTARGSNRAPPHFPILRTLASVLRRNEATTKSGQYVMKPLSPLCIVLFAISACASQPSSPPATAAGGAVQPLSYAAGSSANTTTAYDGTYAGVAIQKLGAAQASVGAGEGYSNCPVVSVPPPVTISNGLAQVQTGNLTFQGYVTPQGALTARTGAGHKFEGQIDKQYVLRGRMVGLCTYDLVWQRSG